MSTALDSRDWLTVGDIGVPIYVEFSSGKRPLSELPEAASIVLIFRDPKGVTFTRTPTIPALPNPQNRARYVSQEGDFTVAGIWRVGGTVTFEDGRVLHVPCDAGTAFTVKNRAPE